MTKQYEVLNWASSFLKKYGCEEKVAELLLQHYVQQSREQFFFNMRESIEQDIVDRFKADIKCHAETGIPYQHLIGYELFYEREFIINEHVLIPRQETEELVYLLINTYKDRKEPLTLVDIGTGSGVIAITLALELPQATVYATDISEDALQVAQQNARKLNANVTFLRGDFLTPLFEQNINPHIIVSNPPYINKADEAMLSDTVHLYEPHLALFAENEGLYSYEQIVKKSINLSSELEALYFEIGFDQAEAVTHLVNEYYPHVNVQVQKDLNGHDRIVYTHF